MEFEALLPGDEKGISEMSAIATEIVRDYYDPIIGKAQNDYMIGKFQTVDAIRGQLAEGYRYYFAVAEGKRAGFLAFYPRGNCMYLSKLYLYKHERGKGYAHEMIGFVAENARKAGFHTIELNVNRNNDSRFIYEKLGMKIAREEKNDIGSGFYMDDYVYSLEI